jgi:hypothetical protein
VTGTARAALIAIVSLNQYDPPTNSRPMTRPMIRPPCPKKAPMPMNRAPMAASRTAVLTVFFMLFSLRRRCGACREQRYGEPPKTRLSPGAADSTADAHNHFFQRKMASCIAVVERMRNHDQT